MVKADELFRQFGFGKTTVADIAAELGMSPANIYKFFSSKEAIIQASCDRNLVVLTEAVHRHMVASGAALDRIEKVLLTVYRHIVDILRNERQVFKLMIRAYEQKWDCVGGVRQVSITNTRETRERRNEHRRIQIRGCIGDSAPPL